MKKYMIILAALFTMAAVSCQKTETSAENEESIHFDFNIASFEPGTKAAKTDWSNGDKLNVWFDGNGSNQTIPDLVLTYNGSQWAAGALRSGVQANLKASGKVTLVYEGYNNLGSAPYKYEWYLYNEWFKPYFTFPTWGVTYASPLVAYAEKQTYSYTSNTVTASISGWKFLTCFKVLVLNDNSEMTLKANEYCLQVKDASNTYAIPQNAWVIYPTGDETEVKYSVGAVAEERERWVCGVPEESNVAFYYHSFSTSNIENNYVTFTLRYGDGSSPASKTFIATNKTIDATYDPTNDATNNNNKCQGVVLKYSQFN